MEGNGHIKEKVFQIADDVEQLKDNLAESILGLKMSIDILSERIKNSAEAHRDSVPIRLVLMLFAIVVLAFAGGAGVAALKNYFGLGL